MVYVSDFGKEAQRQLQSVKLLTTTSRHLSVRGTGLATVARVAWPSGRRLARVRTRSGL